MRTLSSDEYDANYMCAFCYSILGTEKAVIRLPCNDVFHLECVDEECEQKRGTGVICPRCSMAVDENTCIGVSQLKEDNVGSLPTSDLKITTDTKRALSGGKKSLRKKHKKIKNIRKTRKQLKNKPPKR
jgi:hypothetical protein